MAKSHYELLEVAADAPAEEIKRAFRREIARYHPDKVQHLGQEFQDIAAVRAAELTQAYKTLTDATLRAEYDAGLGGHGPAGGTAAPPPPAGDAHEPPAGPGAHAPHAHPPRAQAEAPRSEPAHADAARPAHAPDAPPEAVASQFARDRAGARQFVSRAALGRFRGALDAECPGSQAWAVPGFDMGCLPRGSFFAFKLPPRLLARQTPAVTASTVNETATLLSRVKKDAQRDLCVFLLGQELAPPSELAPAVADLRRRVTGTGGTVFVVPVSTEDWRAHMPADAPALVRSILTRLKP
ncbi:MAG: J domain-containing protein [Vicinamibacterales bacterium]